MAYLPPGRRTLTLATSADAAHVVRAIVLGGEPLDDEILMWWNLLARTHDEVVAWRANWQTALGADEGGDPTMFPLTPRTDGEPEIPAPPLPEGRLVPRARNVR